MKPNQFSLTALGTKWWIEIFDEIDVEMSAIAFGNCAHFITDFENNYSRFKSDSLISTLNREGVLQNPSEECRALLTYGKNLYLRTNTHFNLLTGHIQEARGYDADYSFTSKNVDLEVGNPIINLSILPNNITLTQGKVDIGGYGKGYLIDEIAKILQDKFSIKYFIINGGGDMYATSQFNNPIEIYLEHPTEPKHIIQKTTLFNQGFAASSPFKRIWHTEAGTYSHIITDNNLPKIASFIKASTARDADAFATTALIVDEPELYQLSQTEEFDAVRFNPETNKIWQTANF